ncbi:hypothetical protein BN135_3309 [Cronobacter muytjensii 530]
MLNHVFLSHRAISSAFTLIPFFLLIPITYAFSFKGEMACTF